MKKFYSLFSAVMFLTSTVSAGNSCVIDQQNTAFFSPTPQNVPCAEIGIQYTETLQFKIPASVDLQDYGVPISYILNIDSVVLDSITGLPTGLSWTPNGPGPTYLGGENGCGLTYGTTSVAAGNYPLVFHGLVYVSGQPFPGFFDGDTSFPLQQLIETNQGEGFSIDVIAAGSACPPVSGINTFRSDLNSLLSVFPNPNSGRFEMKLNAGRRVNGEVVIVDVTGKKVYSEQLDVVGMYNTTIDLSNMPKGLYTLQLRTAEGFASKNISVE